jgi:hypothetical protein
MRYTTCSSLLVNYRLDSHQSFVMFFCGFCGAQQLFDLNVYYILLYVVEIVIFFLCTQNEQKI